VTRTGEHSKGHELPNAEIHRVVALSVTVTHVLTNCDINHVFYVSNQAAKPTISGLRFAFFWVIAQRVVVNLLPNFRDEISIPSSRVKMGSIV